MRKIIAIVLALVMVMGMSTTAFAATGASTKTTQLTAYVYSSYEITIPAQVDLTETNNTVTISVDSLNLDPDYVLAVMTAAVNMTHSSGETVEMEMYVNGTQKAAQSVIAGFTEPGSVTIDIVIPETAPAGNYTGYIRFEVDTISADDPGLTE